MPSLLLGCGNSREKKAFLPGRSSWVEPLVTLDMNPNCGADFVHDLEVRPLPFHDEQFDEIAAYDVLEHIGRQGDWKGFFEEFAEYWRILKPGGYFGIIVPTGPDMHADPGHTRFFSKLWFRFLDQHWYPGELAAGRQVTDYRWFWKHSFETVAIEEIGDHHIGVILRKPMRTESIALGDVRVAIGMPVGKPIPHQTLLSVFSTAYQLGQMGISCDYVMEVCGVVQIGRDSVLDGFLQTKADKLFWIDSDMVWEPADFLTLLALSTKYDIVSAAYLIRNDDGLFQVNTDGLPSIAAPSTNEYGLKEVSGLGLGFCIVDRKCCEYLASRAPRVKDGFSGREMAEVFRIDKTADGYRRTEDIAFFADLREAGFKVMCAPSIELGHVGEREWRGKLSDTYEQPKDSGSLAA